MKKFSFRLERVRAFRKLQMEQEKAKLDACFTRLREIEAAAAELDRQVAAASGAVRQPGSGGEHRPYESYRAHAGITRRSLAAQRAQALAAIATQQSNVLAARQRFEMLDKFRDRAKARWKAETDKEQEELAAELYLARRQLLN